MSHSPLDPSWEFKQQMVIELNEFSEYSKFPVHCIQFSAMTAMTFCYKCWVGEIQPHTE